MMSPSLGIAAAIVFPIYLFLDWLAGVRKQSVKSIEAIGDTGDYRIVVRKFVRRGSKILSEREETYRGSGTVFHDADTGARASLDMEGYLGRKIRKFKWDEEDVHRDG